MMGFFPPPGAATVNIVRLYGVLGGAAPEAGRRDSFQSQKKLKKKLIHGLKIAEAEVY